jgi:spoIIIJ-associated protein
MDKTMEATGKTIDDAIHSALTILNLDRDSVSVEVLEKPKSGFLGLGSSDARVLITYPDPRDTRTNAFLEGMLERMELPTTVDFKINEEGNYQFVLSGPKTAILIGRRGETLDAIQHLVSNVANRGEESPVRVSVDAEGYRAKREADLTEMAKHTASKVIKYRKNISLEPMNSYSRHVVHAALQDVEGITTFSVGAEPNRRIIIAIPGNTSAPLPQMQPNRNGKPFFQNRDRGNIRRGPQ